MLSLFIAHISLRVTHKLLPHPLHPVEVVEAEQQRLALPPHHAAEQTAQDPVFHSYACHARCSPLPHRA
jgi:hypothetical protein